MKPETKQQVKTSAKVGGAIALGAAFVAVVSHLTLLPPPRVTKLCWPFETNRLSEFRFEIAGTTDLVHWYVVTNAIGTNFVAVVNNGPREFYAISRTILLRDERRFLIGNLFTNRPGWTNDSLWNCNE